MFVKVRNRIFSGNSTKLILKIKVVFGKVVKGKSAVRRMENVKVTGDKPDVKVVIDNCGEIKEGADDGTMVDDGTGDKYPIFPDEIEGITTAQRIEISNELKLIGNQQLKGKEIFFL